MDVGDTVGMKLQKLLGWCALLVSLGVGTIAFGQANETQLREKLVGQPLYLRGAWGENTLAFDGAGQPLKGASAGALTLGGVNVTGVSVRGKRLTISGERVALVADANGVLQRQTPSSSTLIVGSLMPKGKRVFKAKEEMKITVEADGAGSFDAALKAVFANGLAELATTVPSYWSCYAEGYFKQALPADEAQKTVQACVRREDLSQVNEGEPIEGGYVPPRMIRSEPPSFPPEASELGVQGTTYVHCTVTRNGVCEGYQVVQAVGGGVEESLLTYLYQAKFEPGTKGGIPVNADYEAEFRFKKNTDR
jgi:TonB family protein